MMMPLLPQEIAPVTPDMMALTERFLLPKLRDLQVSLQILRRRLDSRLKPAMPFLYGKPYPLGRCETISREAIEALPGLLRLRADPGMAALHDFVQAGGQLRSIWGVLRGRYFQNAIQAGALYIDVANDTVDPNKPQIEILPLAESGMESVRDIAHFASIARSYWQAEIYANHVLPSLAPLLPMWSLAPEQPPLLQSACDYMIALMMRDGFRDAEHWLATQPAPPDAVMQRIHAALPAHIPPAPAGQGRDMALAACMQARAEGRQQDDVWRDARVRDFLAIRF